MDLSKHKRLAVFFALTALLLSIPARSAQDEAWVRLKKSGQVADVGADYAKAANYYEQALKQITTKDESQILDLQALLATDYVHQSKFALAEPLTKHILSALPEVQKTKKFDPEVLVSVKFLSEAYRQTSKGSLPMELRRKNFNQFEPVSLLLADLVAPNEQAIFEQRYDRARQYIYFGEPDQADLRLGQLLMKMPKTPGLPLTTALARAAIELSLHKPQMMEKLQLEYSKKFDEGTWLTYLGRAHLYAANYNEADKDLEKAVAVLAAKKPPDFKALIEAHRTLMSCYDDRNWFAKSEPHARKVVELVVYSKGAKSDEYTKAVGKLVFYLNNLKKTDEAKKWKAKIPNNYDWLLDDDKAGLAK